MTETSGPSDQPPHPVQPPTPQFGATPLGYPNAPYGGAQYPQYGNQYGQYGNAPYGSYGPYGSGPYGYPTGYYAPPQGTNGMAVASLVLGICGFFCVTPFVGLGLGIAALARINKTGQSGKGMAIAGIILSSLWLCLIILMLALGGFHFAVGDGSGTGPSVGQTQAPNGTSA